MQPRLILALKALLAILLLLLLAAQIFAVPAVAATTAERYPDYAYLTVPGMVLLIGLILCVQFTFVCVWRLLSLVARDRIFSRAAFRYVDLILGALVAATIIVIVSLAMLFIADASPPSLTLLAVFGIVIGAGLTLLVIVMRGLLEKALQLEHDLSEVV